MLEAATASRALAPTGAGAAMLTPHTLTEPLKDGVGMDLSGPSNLLQIRRILLAFSAGARDNFPCCFGGSLKRG